MNRVLYLTFDGLSDPLGQSQILPYLVGLSRAGYDITIISLEKDTAYSQHASGLKRILEDADISWSPLPFLNKPPILGSLINLWRMRRQTRKLFRAEPFDLTHCRSYMSALVGLGLKRQFGCKFLFDMRGFWADERTDGGLWNLQNPIYRALYRFFKRAEKIFFQEADAIISLTHAARKHILALGVPVSPIEVIPCCTNLDRFTLPDPKTREVVRAEFDLAASDQVLVYLGSLGTWYCLEEMLEFFSILKSACPNWKFLFVTQEPPATVLKAAKKYQLEYEVRVVSARPSEVPRYLQACDLAISFIKPCFSKIASSPTKLGEYLATGLPTVANGDIGDMAYFQEHYAIGPVVPRLERIHYQSAIDSLEDFLQKDKSEFRQLAHTCFDLKAGVHSYHQVYHTLLETKCI